MPDQSNRFCSQCGASIRADAKFCSACGTPVEKSEIAAEETRMAAPPPPPITQAPQPKKSGRMRGCVIIACVLVGGFIVLVQISKLGNTTSTAKSMRVQADIEAIKTQLQLYGNMNGFYPTTEQGLQALVTEPQNDPRPTRWYQLFKDRPKDPWGSDYIYRNPGLKNTGGYDLFSAGPDRQPDTADDDWGGAPSTSSATPVATPQESSTSIAQVTPTAGSTSPASQPAAMASVTPVPSPTETPQNLAAVSEAKKNGLVLAKKAFDSRNDYLYVLLAYWDANEKRLAKQYGDEGSSDYYDALDEATKQEFDRLLEAAIGPKPKKEGDYDNDVSNRVYFNVYAHVEKVLKESLNDPESYQGGKAPEFMLTQYKKDWAWGATLDYRAKNAFGAVMKDSINIYVARNSIIGVEHGEPRIAAQNLQRALEKNLKGKKPLPQMEPKVPNITGPDANDQRLTKFTNQKYGCAILVPLDVFPDPPQQADDEHTKFVSTDGRTTLELVVDQNPQKRAVAEVYRKWIAQGEKKGAIGYKTLKGNWFVVSGDVAGRGYYTKCVGRDNKLFFMNVDYDEEADAIRENTMTTMSRSFNGRP